MSSKDAHSDAAKTIIKRVIIFLRLFMTQTMAKRLVSIILVSVGIPAKRVTELTGYCDRSVRELIKGLRENGVTDALFHVGGGGRHASITGYEQQIIKLVKTNNCTTLQQIVDLVKDILKIKTNKRSISNLLKKKGIRKLKCGSLPAKADIILQRRYYDNVLFPLICAAQRGQVSLQYVDASHFVMGSEFLGNVYSSERRFIKTFSGRLRYNVLAAIDYFSKKVTTVCNDTYITADQVCELLRKIEAAYKGLGIPIYVVLDNARYQKCNLVMSLAKELNINLCFIPPYSPNLNLIERLWKFTKKNLRTKYYSDFDLFKETIDSIVSSTTTDNYTEVCRFISSRVQMFDDLVPVTDNSFEKVQKDLVA